MIAVHSNSYDKNKLQRIANTIGCTSLEVFDVIDSPQDISGINYSLPLSHLSLMPRNVFMLLLDSSEEVLKFAFSSEVLDGLSLLPCQKGTVGVKVV